MFAFDTIQNEDTNSKEELRDEKAHLLLSEALTMVLHLKLLATAQHSEFYLSLT